MADNDDNEAVLFRSKKKRKVYRMRTDEIPEQDVTSTSTVSGSPALDSQSATATADVNMAEILRLRKLHKQRVGGVLVRATDDLTEGAVDTMSQTASQIEPAGQTTTSGTRFLRHVAPISDVNRHMMEYIDSRLDERRHAHNVPERNSAASAPPPDLAGREVAGDASKQPATLGKIQEVELDAPSLSHVKPSGDRGQGPTRDGIGRPKKARLGPDGKPWRGRKRRPSDDIKRDAIVDAVLRENTLELYEKPVVQPSNSNGNADNDEKLAEIFRQEYMDEVSQRQRKKPAASTANARGTAASKEEELLRGPKLGGSRQQRAAMREFQLKEIREGKK